MGIRATRKKGQVMLEFAFCMVVLFLMMYGLIMVFRWVGLDLGQRQQAHDTLLRTDIVDSYGGCASFDAACELITYAGDPACCIQWSTEADGPLRQIDPYFYKPTRMNAVWEGD